MSAAVRVLYVGRNRAFARQIHDVLLDQAGIYAPELHQAITFLHLTSQKQTLQELRSAPCSGLLLELDRRKNSRIRFCLMLRARLPDLCIIAVGQERFREQAEAAFDQFFPIPLNIDQARPVLQRLLRGQQGTQTAVGALNLDRSTRTVDGPAGRRKLSPKLFDLLSLLMENVGRTVSREEIMQVVWHTEYVGDTRTLDVHIHWLRACIEPEPSGNRYLETVRGEGYRLNV